MMLNTVDADKLQIWDCMLLQMLLQIMNQNPQTDTDSKF